MVSMAKRLGKFLRGTPAAINPPKVERIEAELLRLPQVEVPLQHRFAPGIYLREVVMPAGTIVIGHQHKTEHFNIVLSGRALVSMNGVTREIVAPCILKSEVGVRKILYIREEMRWATIHPTDETDVAKLEDSLIVKSSAWLDYSKEVEKIQLLAEENSVVGGVNL
jgi:hypothetical protein